MQFEFAYVLGSVVNHSINQILMPIFYFYSAQMVASIMYGLSSPSPSFFFSFFHLLFPLIIIYKQFIFIILSETLQEEAGRLKFVCASNDGIDEHMVW